VTSQRVERRLAAILAADVANYSRLMGLDEVGTLETLKAHRREVIDPAIAEHKGRIVKTTGDGMLVEFGSAVDAVTCAIAIQEKMVERSANGPEPRIRFRIGINVGDIIIDGGDIFGDGVNVAARVENECEPGGVYVSANAFEQIRGKTKFAFDDLGDRTVKNIERPVRLYAVRCAGSLAMVATEAPPAPGPNASDPLPPDRPSIAVLPFKNMSGDPEQEYFADGMVEEIITVLSRFRSFLVIARNSSFVYKNRIVDIKQIGRELGVRYVLEGSVRKAANRVRIAGQLIEALTGAHLWADRFEGALEDIFDLQDQVASSVVSAVAPTLVQAEIERAKAKPTESLDAYDFYLRGLGLAGGFANEHNNEALRLLYKAIELDPGFATAHGVAAGCYIWRQVNGWTTDYEREVAEIARLARRAAELGKNDAVALSFGGIALARILGDLQGGIALIDRALVLNPNLATAWNFSGWARAFLGEIEIVREHSARAMRLSPLDPLLHVTQMVVSLAYFIVERYPEASSWAEKALREQPNFQATIRLLAASKALSGDLAGGRDAIEHARRLDPDMRISNLKHRVGPYRPDDFARYIAGLRLAGLPE
jgi:TolB-like protein/class 3 adenylate cyclase